MVPVTNHTGSTARKLCLVSSVPGTLWAFYRQLINALPAEGFEVGVVCSEGPTIELLGASAGTRVHPLGIQREITPLRDVRTVAALVRILRHHGYSIVHGHTPKGGLLAMLAASMTGVRHRVYTLHGLPLETETGIRRALLANTERVSCRLAGTVLVVSPSLRARAQRLRLCPPTKLRMLGDGSACGIALDEFSRTPETFADAAARRQELGIPGNARVIGYVGRLVPDKGIHILLQAFLQLAPSRPDIYLLVVGDFEPHRGNLDPATVEQLKTHPRIRRVPFTHRIVSYYAAMDMLVLPTRREGFPYSLLEAAAMQLPVVATCVTGCVDAVVHGETGFLTAPEDPRELATAMDRLLGDADVRCRFGEAARDLVLRKFPADRMVREHIRLYRDMLRGN